MLAPAGTCGAPAQTTRGRATEPAQAAPASADQAAAVAAEAAAAFGSGSGDVTEEEEVGGEERPADGMAWEVCALCCGVLPWRHKGTLHQRQSATACVLIMTHDAVMCEPRAFGAVCRGFATAHAAYINFRVCWLCVAWLRCKDVVMNHALRRCSGLPGHAKGCYISPSLGPQKCARVAGCACGRQRQRL